MGFSDFWDIGESPWDYISSGHADRPAGQSLHIKPNLDSSLLSEHHPRSRRSA